jgi:hypothetical protein
MHRALEPSMAWLVQLAVDSDDPAQLVAAAAAAEPGHPVGLVGPAGEDLAHAPDDEDGRRALAVARAAARNGLVAPPGWRIVRLARTASLGFLAVSMRGADRPDPPLQLLPALLTGQLARAALLHGQRAALVHRLISGHLSADDARREDAELGVPVANTYWPGLLAWRNVPPRADVVTILGREARRLLDRSLTVVLDGRLILLHGGDAANGDLRPQEWFETLVAEARRLAPSSRAQAIVAEGPTELEGLADQVALLVGCLRFGPRAQADRAVVSVRQFGLDRLLWDNIATEDAERFVQERLGRLIAWDHEHRGGLLVVLEAALDFPRADQAATKCFMHRNTFRHHLRQAVEVLGDELDDPDVQLAVHTAMKLRRLLRARAAGGTAGAGAPGGGGAHDAPGGPPSSATEVSRYAATPTTTSAKARPRTRCRT